MRKIHIAEWEGRVGNNLIQLGRALHLAKCVGAEVILPDAGSCDTMQQELFLYTKTTQTSFMGLRVPGKTEKKPYRFMCERAFYDIPVKLPPLFTSKFNSGDRIYSDLLADQRMHRSQYSPRMRDIFIQHIKPHLDRNVFRHVKKKSIDSDTLTIHLRAGDIMNPKTTHPHFPQAPLSFFTKVLSGEKFRKVIVCTEHSQFANPVLRYLVTYCQNRNIECDVSHRSAAEDMYILANSTNLAVGGNTSFSRSLILCSPEICNIFVPRIVDDHRPEIMVTSFYNNPSVRVTSYVFPDYFPRDSAWLASEEQKHRMISHPEEKVVLHSIT